MMIDYAVFSSASGDEWTMFGIGLETWLAAGVPIVLFFLGVWKGPTVKRIPGGIARVAQWTYRKAQREIITPIQTWRLRQLHGVRIGMLNVDTWDGLRALSEEDQNLFQRLRWRDYTRLIMAHAHETLDREPFEWEIEAQARIDKAAMDHAVYTQSGEKLECWNCAFFVGDLKKNWKDEYERNPYGGYCYRELPRQETQPGNFCGGHSALQGYLRSRAALYNIAPIE